jgi:predicted Zn-dependent protease
MDELVSSWRDAIPADVDHATLRWVDERTELLTVRNGVVEPPVAVRDAGVMVTVQRGGGVGYAGTSDLSASGVRAAFARARAWADATAGRLVYDPAAVASTPVRGAWSSPAGPAWESWSMADRLAAVRAAEASLAVDERVVERVASVMSLHTRTLLLGSGGTEVWQEMRAVSPELEATAAAGGAAQRRTLGGLRGASLQGGVDVLDRFGFLREGPRVAGEALELLTAPECPSGTMDLILAPDQMMLQIHESIGHPLELDRILGDERNYAGTSFVTPDMFGSYAYGSPLLDVTFAPDVPGEFAAYGWDDEGAEAQRAYLIRAGILLRPLGGALSQARAGLPGVANSRATSWNRAPIDRMANLNVEPGASSLAELIGGVERGVWMETNRSWSIDDSRNKFQFGCELGREIVDGQLGRVVRNPGYRGISASFWRSLTGVGDASTFQVWGTPYCGKGEPNQIIRVGHASPACRFAGVDVFGGGA